MSWPNALVPGSARVAVPSRWRSLQVSKQGDDEASGLHCIVTAARQFCTIAGDTPSRRILKALAPSHASRIQARLPAIGLYEKDVRALAAAAELSVYRPNTHDAAHFQEPGWLWMAFVLVKLTAPSGAESDQSHYVLVLDHVGADGVFVVADPHPWNPPVYCAGVSEFESAWRGAKAKGPPWAASLYRRGT